MHKTIKALLISASALAAGGQATVASAHTVNLSLGADAGATDFLQVNCSTDAGAATDHLILQIQTNSWTFDPSYGATNSRLSAQISESMTNPPVAMNVTAPAATGSNSQTLRIPGGNGSYNVAVNKTAPGPVVLTLTLHCMNADESIHTGTDSIILQQQ